jgi:hypothetical protein
MILFSIVKIITFEDHVLFKSYFDPHLELLYLQRNYQS